jgi:hypothetical protein
LFIDKKDSKLKTCIDYWALDKITIKNNYPLPRIVNLLDQLNGYQYYNQIDFKSGYYQICIMDEDVEKTSMKTMYSSYGFLVMPFELCNTLSMFITFMNSIFHEKLDEFVIIYISDILVYSKIPEEHMNYFEYVMSKL